MRFHGYFYPRPPRGGRRSAPLFRPSSRNYFYPRPPRGGRRQARSGRQVAQDISIHALREEGDYTVQIVHVGAVISIHALREEGDKHTKRTAGSVWHFYPRPPRGGRLGQHTEGGGRFLFLSTPSARRATLPAAAIRSVIDDFYPRPPRGGRRSLGVSTLYYAEISIHALREEGDRTAHGISNAAYRFLSTPSARRATGADEGIRQAQAISIHALREEGDVTDSARSPMILSFLSTPSARRATG